jgi:hypothetical protein
MGKSSEIEVSEGYDGIALLEDWSSVVLENLRLGSVVVRSHRTAHREAPRISKDGSRLDTSLALFSNYRGRLKWEEHMDAHW